MSTTAETRFEQLLSTRAQIGRQRGGGGAWPSAPTQYEFGGGKPDPGSFPYDEIVEATRTMMAAEGAQALTYGEPQGYKGLRELLAHKHEVFEGLQVDPDNILLANGSLHALSLVIAAFVDIGDAVICEAPSFSGTLMALRRFGADLHGVPVDDQGIVTSVVREKLEALRAADRPCKLIYTMPTFHNPGGPTATLARRQELLALAREFDTLILEDDAYGDLRFEGEFIPSLYALDKDDIVIRAGTLSKILGAGMRLGWLVAPKSLLPILQSFNFGGGVAPFTSRVATYYMRDHMEGHVAKLIDVYRGKRDAMLQGLWEVLEGTDVEISKPAGGFFIWIKLPSAADTEKLAAAAREAGVGYVPGNAFMPNGGGERYIRLAFSYESEENCHAGARHLAAAIRKAMD
jgi:DNA-binding transcriptional MocR family regulator